MARLIASAAMKLVSGAKLSKRFLLSKLSDITKRSCQLLGQIEERKGEVRYEPEGPLNIERKALGRHDCDDLDQGGRSIDGNDRVH